MNRKQQHVSLDTSQTRLGTLECLLHFRKSTLSKLHISQSTYSIQQLGFCGISCPSRQSHDDIWLI